MNSENPHLLDVLTPESVQRRARIIQLEDGPPGPGWEPVTLDWLGRLWDRFVTFIHKPLNDMISPSSMGGVDWDWIDPIDTTPTQAYTNALAASVTESKRKRFSDTPLGVAFYMICAGAIAGVLAKLAIAAFAAYGRAFGVLP